jgi:hypothetical protein
MALTQNSTQTSAATIDLFWRTSWDFFSGSNGAKAGFITDLKETGCTLKTDEPIEFRRWIRMIIRDQRNQVGFTAVGRVVRCENSFEASPGSEVTLYRYRVEFTYPINLAHLDPAAASECYSEREPSAAQPLVRRPAYVYAAEAQSPTSA